MDSKDTNFEAKVKVLKEEIEHHVAEEEGKLFPKVSLQIEPALLESMGVKMEQLFEKEMANDPSANIPGETRRAAPLKGRRGGLQP